MMIYALGNGNLTRNLVPEWVRTRINTFHYFYEDVDTSLGIHLSLTDKFQLIKHLSGTNYSSNNELRYATVEYLWEIGYRSPELEEKIKIFRSLEKGILKTHTRIYEKHKDDK
ncbi:MAG: hypothetical protein QMD85_03095 [Candidatus Aenigmarchaeota archaeon]|nr:hypothetical protein [Candidatus Aenigmarchaeota archaeon]MDI6722518.1 hypothetical protein [Candidatus Aenigmarchaeota archaeon]